MKASTFIRQEHRSSLLSRKNLIISAFQRRGGMYNTTIQSWASRAGISRFKAKDARVEVQLGLEGTLNVLGEAEAVSLPFERQVCDRHTFCTQRLNHQLSLIG